MKPPKAAWTAYAIAAAVILADQISKWWILDGLHLPALGSIPVVWPLRFTMVWNQGVSFGLLQAGHDLARWALVVFSVVVAVLLAAWARRAGNVWNAMGLGLVIGGALGNALDRARLGAVVDFIDVKQLGFFPWVFNIADSAITIGVILLLLEGLRGGREPS